MRFISTRTHGVLDYATGVLLIAAPWLFGFSDAGLAAWIPIGVGIALLAASLMTDYELGAVRAIPMPAHLAMDGLEGVLLIASPWLFGFADRIWWPHVVVGLLELGAAMMTERTPSYAAAPVHQRAMNPSP
jgi:hypothetical protein